MKYIDSSVFIGAFLPTDPNHMSCKKIIEDMIAGKLPMVISIFVTLSLWQCKKLCNYSGC